MKKILYGCVALTVLITAVAIVEVNKKSTPVTSPETPEVTVATQGQQAPETTTPSERTYSEAEDQIQQAFENYIYFKGMDEVVRTDVRADGNDFIITITNPSDASVQPQELRLARVEDFAGKAQYKLNNTSLLKWQALSESYLENPTVGADSFSEELAWVPELGLITNQSLKASNVSLTNTGFNVSIKSMVSDMLTTAEGDKMNIAGSSNVSDMKITTTDFVIQAPSITQSMQINGANQNGNVILQLLTASNATSSLNIPILGIGMAAMPSQPILGQLTNKVGFADNITLDTTLSNIKMTQSPLPMLPDTITSNITIEGVSKEMLIAYINLRDQLNEMPDEESTEAKELAQKLLAAQNQILKSLSLKINKLSLTNPNIGIDITGIIHYAEPAPVVNARVSVTNFDVISPKAPDVDEAACKAALAAAPAPSAGGAPIVPAACVQQVGLLEGLRPYLATAEHTTNEKGQPVDTFSVLYSAGSLAINNQPILTPGQQPTPTENEASTTDGMITEDEIPVAPVAQQNDTPNMPTDTQTDDTVPMAETPSAFAQAQTNDVAPAQAPSADEIPSVAGLIAIEASETITNTNGTTVAGEEVAALAAEQPTLNDVAANSANTLTEEIDDSMTEDVADTPLEAVSAGMPAYPALNENAPALDAASAPETGVSEVVQPLAPIVDSAEIIEAQKLLNAVE